MNLCKKRGVDTGYRVEQSHLTFFVRLFSITIHFLIYQLSRGIVAIYLGCVFFIDYLNLDCCYQNHPD